MELLFISDLHLDRQHPEIGQALLDLIEARATHARALYILGDLFEVWLGDDDEADYLDPVFDALTRIGQSTELYFMHGNRDFLVGQDLAGRLGMQILADPQQLQLGKQKVALMHGDLLCSDDVDYQAFRQMVRAPDWQQQFLDRPLAERQEIAAGLRAQSNDAMRDKAPQIMDVNADTVEQYFDQLGVDVLIHGHTHRPAIHRQADGRQRIVLGDWRPGPSFLSWRDGQFDLVDDRV